jgi:predicted P-loop ATPase
MQLLGVWIIEIAELDSMSRADVSRVKAFISRSTDRFRLPYGRRVQDQLRRCVFAGTVNASDYLRDDTGNRRFWPVACSVVRLEELRRDRDQLWAEAVHRFREEERWWLDDVALVADAEQEQAARVPPDPWQERIEKYLAGRDDVSTTEILTDCIGKPVENQQRRDEMRVGAVLRSLKWQRYREPRSGPASSRPRRYRRIEV